MIDRDRITQNLEKTLIIVFIGKGWVDQNPYLCMVDPGKLLVDQKPGKWLVDQNPGLWLVDQKPGK